VKPHRPSELRTRKAILKEIHTYADDQNLAGPPLDDIEPGEASISTAHGDLH